MMVLVLGMIVVVPRFTLSYCVTDLNSIPTTTWKLLLVSEEENGACNPDMSLGPL